MAGPVLSPAFVKHRDSSTLHCIYPCLNVTYLHVVTLECRVCCQVELFIKVLIIDVYIDLYMLLLIRN